MELVLTRQVNLKLQPIDIRINNNNFHAVNFFGVMLNAEIVETEKRMPLI